MNLMFKRHLNAPFKKIKVSQISCTKSRFFASGAKVSQIGLGLFDWGVTHVITSLHSSSRHITHVSQIS